jgi:hypothetical protein
MADRKISELNNITGANLADDDEFALVDTSADETKAITFGEFKTALDTATGFVRITGDTMTGDLTTTGLTLNNGATIVAINSSNVNSRLDLIASRTSSNLSSFLFKDDQDRSKLSIAQSGDISFYEDTGTTPKFFWDASAESLGIGTSSPAQVLHLASSAPDLRIEDTDGGYADINVAAGSIELRSDQGNTQANSTLKMFVDGSEAMRIDSSGNLLHDTTTYSGASSPQNSSSSADAGTVIEAGGTVQIGRYQNSPLRLNRMNNDGAIAEFRKNGSTVGSIGTNGNIYLAGVSSGLRIRANDIIPTDDTGAGNDNALDLGIASQRWKDLYLSGGVYLGGTGSANKLDDYETGTWTPTLPNGGTLTNQRSTYVKIGNTVTVTTYVTSINPTANGSIFFLGGLPFTNVNTSNYYVGGSFGYTGQNNLGDLMPITGVNLDYIYFHENDGQAASVSNNTMRSKGLTGDSGDAMILTITYFT